MAVSSAVELSTQTVEDVNLLTKFLADSQLSSLSPPIIPTTAAITINPRVLILVGSALLDLPSAIFTFFQAHTLNPPTDHLNPTDHPYSSISTLVITGGIGHSTAHLYDAILAHSTYFQLPSLIGRSDGGLTGLSEARLFYLIFIHFYDGEHVAKSWNGGRGLKVIVEDESTNCGANAIMSRAMLDRNALPLGNGGRDTDDGEGDDVIIVQDPTMSLRTKASFEKVYEDQCQLGRVRFWTWPVVLPVVRLDEAGDIVWNTEDMSGVDAKGLWTMRRFFGLILGEIPRLRDDEDGYGPRGKGFITHVDIPFDVQIAWERLRKALDHSR